MTKTELDQIINDFDRTVIQPEKPMNLIEMKAYVKGFEDARNAMLGSADRCYRSMKTD